MRELTDFDRWQLARLRAMLEANSSRTSMDWTLIAELQASKAYLTDVDLEHLVVEYEAAEEDRVKGLVMTPLRMNPEDDEEETRG